MAHTLVPGAENSGAGRQPEGTTLRDVLKLFSRLVLGAYMVVHGSQKLFGAFGGAGLEKAGAGFESMGLRPGKEMAIVAGATELVQAPGDLDGCHQGVRLPLRRPTDQGFLPQAGSLVEAPANETESPGDGLRDSLRGGPAGLAAGQATETH